MWTDHLDRETAAAVQRLAQVCAEHDGTAPLNEEAVFALADGSARHLPKFAEAGMLGYLQWQPQHHTAQLMVHPEHRRTGIASALFAELASGTDAGLWAFGNLPAARGFAAAHRLSPARELLIMSRPLAGITPAAPPAGLVLRGYRPGDAADLLAINAAAFADHPEQGGLDAAGLAARMNEDWFDPDGLIMATDASGPAGFHWTKRVDAEAGEVYVVAVAPRAQGLGYGKALLAAGLEHLARVGLTTVVLYVDRADAIAVRMYERAGFTAIHTDVLYASEPGARHDLH